MPPELHTGTAPIHYYIADSGHQDNALDTFNIYVENPLYIPRLPPTMQTDTPKVSSHSPRPEH